MAVFHDVSELHSHKEKLRLRLHYDTLTGLANRQLFLDRLQVALKQAHKHGEMVGILSLDLDHFKKVNDSLGPQYGDEFLTLAAQRLQSCCQEEDTVARLGGDEFGLLLPGISSPETLIQRIQQLQQQMNEPFALAGEDVVISCTIGVSCYPEDGGDPHSLLSYSDMALYQAKLSEIGSYAFYHPQLQEGFQKRLRMEGQLHQAFKNQEFLLHYQPKVDPQSGHICGCEALVRWQRPGEGMVSPGEFLPILENAGLMRPLGLWVLEEAARQMRLWRQAGFTQARMAVNLSAKQFQSPELAEIILRILHEQQLPAKALTVEITEDAILDDIDGTLPILHQLSQAGIALSLDDFGTGYSSLSYLQRLPMDEVKIDKSFVMDIPDKADDIAIVKAIVSLSHNLGLRTVAEGVETSVQRDYLATLGCHCYQGFFFSRPLPAAAFSQLLN